MSDKITQYLYRHYDKDNILLYIGISLHHIVRLSQHKGHSHWYSEITTTKIEKFDSREDVVKAERAAITNENPLYNVHRPSIKEQKQKISQSNESREVLLKRVVQFNPLYSISEVATVLDTGVKKIKELCEQNKIGYIATNERWSNRFKKMVVTRKITGWQLIDFIENLEKKSIGWD